MNVACVLRAGQQRSGSVRGGQDFVTGCPRHFPIAIYDSQLSTLLPPHNFKMPFCKMRMGIGQFAASGTPSLKNIGAKYTVRVMASLAQTLLNAVAAV